MVTPQTAKRTWASKPSNKLIGTPPRRRKFTANEPEPKAFLPESRSVKKANSYQYYDGRILDKILTSRSHMISSFFKHHVLHCAWQFHWRGFVPGRQVRRRLCALVVLLAFALSNADATTARILILHTNDIHDHIRPGCNGVGGLVYVAGYIAQVQAACQDVLVLDAGDVAEKGDLLAFKTQSQITFEALRRIGYDAVTIGNHDHDQGVEWLHRSGKAMGQPFVCLNRVTADGKPIFAPSRVVQIGAMKVGIIGLIVPQDEGTLSFAETGKQLAMEAERLDRDVHLVIALCHVGSGVCKGLAKQAPAVDVFVSGHTHEVLEKPIRLPENGALIVQAGDYARWVGRLELEVELDSERILSAQGELVEMKHDSIAPDAKLLAWVREREAAICPEAGRIVLQNEEVVGAEISWLAAEGMKRQAGVDLGFCHPGHIIRGGVPVGPIDVNALFLTGGQRGFATVRTTLTGAEIEAYLNALAASHDQTAWSGFKVTRPPGAGGQETLVTDLLSDRQYTAIFPELEWSKRFLRAANREKTRRSASPLAAREFVAEPTEVHFTDALVAYLENMPKAKRALQELVKERMGASGLK